jgi:hypothetical protein
MVLHRGQPSRLPFGALNGAALTAPGRDARAHCDEGNGKTVLARFESFAAPSTLWESGHFYFALTVTYAL